MALKHTHQRMAPLPNENPPAHGPSYIGRVTPIPTIVTTINFESSRTSNLCLLQTLSLSRRHLRSRFDKLPRSEAGILRNSSRLGVATPSQLTDGGRPEEFYWNFRGGIANPESPVRRRPEEL
ncbi:unnamed protein product, partial [Iphiclides podalirius]